MQLAGAVTRLVERVRAFDLAVDDWVDRVRSPALDPVFYGLSSAADHGLVWLGIGAVASARDGDPGVFLRLGTAIGIESALTNGPIKLCFRRVRPVLAEPDEPLPYGMHRPVTSSFPSGHAASAFTAAVVLAGSPLTPAYFALATGIAASRVYVRLHHTSDIVAGAALGIGLGLVARRLLPMRG
ncbi:MAG: phosphatase PAP2 family protein [Acidimicrobiia bacterium]